MKPRMNTEVAKKLFREISREWKLTPGEAAALLGGDVHVDSRQLTEDELAAAGVTTGYVRLCIGLEHIDDIIYDIEQALEATYKKNKKKAA